MAEFQDIMKQAKRMCNERYECGDCPLREMVDKADIYCPIQTMRKLDAAKVEAAVMDWAEKHPEQRYPTWKEWHDTMFAESFVKEVPCPKFFLDQARGEILCAESEGCPDCWSTPIPADIAEKLGIKPIGGKDDA